ncbi:MAG TPA: ribonuclease HII [Rhodospirillales bacterium]
MPDFAHEERARRDGYAVVAGVDEAGRGPLAGPVLAGAVILEAAALSPALRQGLDDSKKLSPAVREELFEALGREAVIGVGQADVDEIDALNILQATMLAMSRAVKGLARRPDMALVDGNREPALDCRVRCVIGGDAKSLSIAAASIVAKVTRDRIMANLARGHPGYGWERNAGYGTAEHLAALRRLGVTPEHRRSYAPIRNMLRSTAS